MPQTSTDREAIRMVGAEHEWQLLDAGHGGDQFSKPIVDVVVYYDADDTAMTAIYKEYGTAKPGPQGIITQPADDAKTKAITWLSQAHNIEIVV